MIGGSFAQQARACESLGSPFTAAVLRGAFASLGRDTALGRRILDWPGDTSSAGASVPLRVAGGLHALVLRDMDARLGACYPPNDVPRADLVAAIAAALHRHEAFLSDWIDSPPQTNEVGRSAPLIAAGHLIARHFNMPLELLELGASAGLNLYWDKVAVRANGGRLGARDAALTLAPDWSGELPKGPPPEIARRAGVDINPLDVGDAQDRLRLLAYVWPDQTARLERMKAAQKIARAAPPDLARGDAIAWLTSRLAAREKGRVLVIYHTVAWQYFSPETQAKGRAIIAAAGAGSTAETPLVWLSMEADGRSPGAALLLRHWPGDQRIPLGRADFHGRWVNWVIGAKGLRA